MPLKRWNGSAWVDAVIKRWNGSAWVAADIKKWTGSVWEGILESLIWSGTDVSATSGVNSNAERCGFRVHTDGTADITDQFGVYGLMDGWLSQSPANINDYEMKWTATGTKTFSSPFTENVWNNMQAGTWLYAAGPHNRTAIITVTIRKDGDAASEVSKSITLTQTWEP